MEFEPLNENLEWEMRRIAAAFGMPNCESGMQMVHNNGHIFFFKSELSLEVHSHDYVIDTLQVGRRQGEYCEVWRNDDTNDWCIVGEPQNMCNLMARALYCLGFEDEEVFAELKCSLSAHDKMEFRLSMPHDFWPQKWQDEAQ